MFRGSLGATLIAAPTLTKNKAKERDPDRSDAKPEDLNAKRQIVETAFAFLIDRLHLRFPRARTFSGLVARIAAKVAALNLSVLVNQLWGNPLPGALVDPIA